MKLSEMIAAVQRTYGLDADGIAGPKTWGAIYRDRVKGDPSDGDLPPSLGLSDITTIDARSERAIQTLLPQVRPYARALVHAAADQGIKLVVTGGTRTYAEQDALFEQGGVTKARGGYSNHNFGIAFDVTIFAGKKPVWESPLYKVVGSIGRGIGLDWGGAWKNFVDEPHFQLRPTWAKGMSERDMLAELRARKTAGTGVFA